MAATLQGCAMQGPDAMRVSRLEYNEALQLSEQREQLLNLVRLRYADSPEFLAVSGIAAQLGFETRASVGGDFGQVEESTSAFLSPGASVGYSETPTITFTPRRDQAFTRQLVSPIDLDSVHLLTRYGWRVDRVLRLVARDVNGVRNDVSREAHPDGTAQRLRTFSALAGRLEQFRATGLVTISAEQRPTTLSPPLQGIGPDDVLAAQASGYRVEHLEGDPARYVLVGDAVHHILLVNEQAWRQPAFVEAATALGLEPGLQRYDIDPGKSEPESSGDTLRIDTRSLLGTMAYLSNAVAIPGSHAHGGLAASARDLRSALTDLLAVHVSAEPVGATLAVPYRGHWFYVDEGDLSTKRTLGLLNALTRLTISAGGAENVPVLTLPVSR